MSSLSLHISDGPAVRASPPSARSTDRDLLTETATPPPSASLRHLFSFSASQPQEQRSQSPEPDAVFRLNQNDAPGDMTTDSPESKNKTHPHTHDMNVDLHEANGADTPGLDIRQVYVNACSDQFVRHTANKMFSTAPDAHLQQTEREYQTLREQIKQDFKLKRQSVMRGRKLGNTHVIDS